MDLEEIIHQAFTTADVFLGSENSVLRLTFPRDAYTRTIFDKEFIRLYKERFKIFKPKWIPIEIAYFLRHYERFYDNPVLKKLMKEKEPNKVVMSNEIQKFFLSTGELECLRNTDVRYNDGSVDHMRWVFKKPPKNLMKYIYGKN